MYFLVVITAGSNSMVLNAKITIIYIKSHTIIPAMAS